MLWESCSIIYLSLLLGSEFSISYFYNLFPCSYYYQLEYCYCNIITFLEWLWRRFTIIVLNCTKETGKWIHVFICYQNPPGKVWGKQMEDHENYYISDARVMQHISRWCIEDDLSGVTRKRMLQQLSLWEITVRKNNILLSDPSLTNRHSCLM